MLCTLFVVLTYYFYLSFSFGFQMEKVSLHLSHIGTNASQNVTTYILRMDFIYVCLHAIGKGHTTYCPPLGSHGDHIITPQDLNCCTTCFGMGSRLSSRSPDSQSSLLINFLYYFTEMFFYFLFSSSFFIFLFLKLELLGCWTFQIDTLVFLSLFYTFSSSFCSIFQDKFKLYLLILLLNLKFSVISYLKWLLISVYSFFSKSNILF